MQMYHENNFDICSGHYVMQVVVESQIETNSISFPFENTVHDNIYAVINWLASCFGFTGHFYAISWTYLVSFSVACFAWNINEYRPQKNLYMQ